MLKGETVSKYFVTFCSRLENYHKRSCRCYCYGCSTVFDISFLNATSLLQNVKIASIHSSAVESFSEPFVKILSILITVLFRISIFERPVSLNFWEIDLNKTLYYCITKPCIYFLIFFVKDNWPFYFIGKLIGWHLAIFSFKGHWRIWPRNWISLQ